MPKCSRCDHHAPSLGQLRKHAAERHPNSAPRKARKSKNTPPPIHDRERRLLDELSTRFDDELASEELGQDAYDRVLAYLAQRYGSAASEEAA